MTALGGATLMNNIGTAGSLLPVVGAFVADAYLGRFTTISAGCIISFLVSSGLPFVQSCDGRYYLYLRIWYII
jgi:dipeptide/tripeptide permease